MSAIEAQDFTPGERAALDRVTVPAMRAGFAADIVSAASAGAPVAPRRMSRGGWMRPGRTMIAVGALALASATAAATGMLGKLPIAIPGIARVAEAPAGKPKPVRVAKPRAVAEPRPQALASAPVADPMPAPLTPFEQWKARRDQRIALGLPVRNGPPPLVRRAIAARLQAMPADKRAAVMAEWRRIKALPQPERKAEIARLKADFLARNPAVAAKIERRKQLRAAGGQPQPFAQPGAATPRPGWGNGNPQLTPEERAQRRERWQQWRAQRRAWRMRQGQDGAQPQPPAPQPQ